MRNGFACSFPSIRNQAISAHRTIEGKEWLTAVRELVAGFGGHGRRSGFEAASPLSIWMIPHLEHQFASIGDVGMPEPRLVERLAVQRGRLDVLILHGCSVCNDGEDLAVSHAQVSPGEDRAADLVYRAAGANRVETHRAQNVPGRGLASIIISRNAEWAVAVPDIHQLAHAELGFPGLA